MPDTDKRGIHKILKSDPAIEFSEAYLLEDFFGIGFRTYRP